jgi:hypothetical protein
MTDFSLKNLTKDSNNRKRGVNPLTIRKMIYDLQNKERLEKIEVKRRRYSISELANELSISMDELIKFKTFINSYPTSKTSNDDISYKIIRLYCNTKLCEE